MALADSSTFLLPTATSRSSQHLVRHRTGEASALHRSLDATTSGRWNSKVLLAAALGLTMVTIINRSRRVQRKGLVRRRAFGLDFDVVLPAELQTLPSEIQAAAAQISNTITEELAAQNVQVPSVATDALEASSKLIADAVAGIDPQVLAQLQQVIPSNPEVLAPLLEPVGAGSLVVFLLALRRGPQPWLNELPRSYDPEWIEAYWTRRPLQLISKFLTVGAKSSYFWILLQLDKAMGKEEENMPARASQARELITDLGVAFIKIAQVWASRPDVLPEPYTQEFEKLLEKVRPFGKDQAFLTLRRNMSDVDSLFDDISAFDEPMASASIGQVYKASIDGKTVAVKVQRPDVREQVTIDIYVIRIACKLGAMLPFESISRQAKSSLELISLAAPTWFEELDYKAEAANQKKFASTVEKCDLIRDSIVVPKVILATDEVLVQEWLDGGKLSEPEVREKAPKVVNLLLNSYMVQFLETGYLHGDPHPGNFILMPTGQLGILDYGLMTTIKEDKRVAFIEYLMHLQAKEYDKCLRDLINLEFIPAAIGDDKEALEIIIPTLAQTLGTLYSSGGDMRKKGEIMMKQREEMKNAGKLDILRQQLQDISKKYGSFQLPGYFTLILRAFSTLEGLGLRVDSDFNIVQECFPYIARRLLTDNTLRIREALKSYLYMGRRRVAVKRIDDLASGFGTFTNLMKADRKDYIGEDKVHAQSSSSSSSTSPAKSTHQADQAAPVKLDSAVQDIAALIFSPQGNFLQDILIEEGIAAVDALSRAALLQLIRTAGPLALPLTIPLNLLLGGQDSEGRILTREDKEALLLLRRIVDLLQAPISNLRSDDTAGADVRSVAEALQRLQPLAQGLLPTVAPGATAFARRFAQQLARRILLRLAEEIERGVSGRAPVRVAS